MRDSTSYRIRGKLREFVMLIGMMMLSVTAFSQANIAPLATVSADGTGGGGCRTGACSTLNDLNFGTCGTQQMWISTNDPPSTVVGADYIQWDFPTIKTFDTLVIHHAETGRRFLNGATVQYLDNGVWITHSSFSNLPVQCINRVPIGKLSTDTFRITLLETDPTLAQGSNPNFREIEIIEAPTGLNDAAVMSVDSPMVYCAGTHNVQVTIGNFGINQIDSVDINWEVNGVAQPTVQYIGLLDTINGSFPFSAQVTLGSQTFAAGATQIKAWTSNPNGGLDTVNVNDTVNVSVQSAAAPTALTTTNPTLNSITVNAVGGAGTIDYEYGPVGFVLGNGTTGSSATPTFVINGLTQGTVYDVYVRSNCGSSNTSGWVGPETFFTSYGIPFIQDFEGFTSGITGNPWPEGWSSTTTTDPNWESNTGQTPSGATGPLGDHTTGSGVYCYMETSGGTTGDSADFVSPPIYIDSSLTTVELSYWYFNYGTNVDRMYVIVDTNGVENVIATYTGQQQTAQSDPWLQGAHFLNGYQGKSVRIKFRGINPPCCSGDIAIDDVRIDPVLPLNAGVLEVQSPSGALCPGNITPVVGVKNYGSNTLDSVTVVWDVNGVIDSTKYIGQVLPGDTASVTLGTLNILSTQVYDLKFYTSQPNGQNDQFHPDDTLEINGLQTGLSGTVTVDATQPASSTNFQTLSALTQVLNNYGVCGPTTVDVAVGVYNEPLYLDNIPGLSATNNLKISGVDSSQTIVRHNGTTQYATLTFDNVQHVSVSNMTFENTGTGDAVIFTGSSEYDTLSNSVARVSVTSTAPYCIAVSGAAASNSTGAASDHLVIQNNRVIGGYYGIWSYGGTTDLVTNNKIMNNVVDSAYYAGIYGYYQDSLEVVGNEVYQINRGYNFAYGIMIYYSNNTQILKNYSHATYAAGYFYNFNTYAPVNRKYEITNNMFISDSQYGIYMYYVDSVNIWHNSINNTGTGQGIFIGATATNQATAYDVRNNIFNAASGLALEVNEPDTIVFDKFNNNTYNTGGATLLNIDGTTYTDLLSYQTAQPLFNNASLEGDPQFLSNTDLQIIGAFVDDQGDNSVGVTEDIDGDVRPSPNGTAVDMGADEFDPPTCPPPFNMGAFNPSLDSATIFWSGNNTASTYQYELVPCGSGQGSGTPVVTGSDSLRIGGLTSSTCYEFYVREICGRGDSSLWVGPIQFSTANGIPYAEDFENFTPGITGNPWPFGWSSTTTTDPNWESNTGQTPSFGTGPLGDHTTGTGVYVYMETSGGTVGDSADLVSPPIFVDNNTNVLELKYWYFFHGANIDGMDIIVESNGIESVVGTVRGQQQPNQTDPWLEDKITISGYAGQSIQVKFRGFNVNCCSGDIAVDDISLTVPAPIDGGVSDIIRPVTGCGLGATDSVEVEITNYGLNTLRNFPVSFIVNNGTPVTETYTDSIPAGQTGTYVFTTSTVNLSTPGVYNIVAYTDITSDADSTNDTSSVDVTSIPVLTSYPYSEDFENGQGGWTVGGISSTWAHGAPNGAIINSAASGNNAWVTNLTGLYNNNEESFVVSPCFDMTSLTAPQIKMNVWWDIEFSWDGAVLQSSIDGGATWQKVGAFGAPNNWYTDNTINGLANIEPSQEGWTGTGTSGSGAWVLAEHDLTGLGGQSAVLLRVVFGSDGSVTDEGFGFDDVLVQDAPSNDAGVSAVLRPATGCGLGTADSVEIEVTNFGTASITNVPVAYSLNGATAVTDTLRDTIPAGLTETFVFPSTVNLSTAGTYNLVAYTSLVGDALAINDTTNATIESIPVVTGLPYSESFENGAGGWTTSGTNNSWAVGTPSGLTIATAGQGTQSFVTNLSGDYNNSEVSYLESPCLDFSALTNDPEISFLHTYITESCCDEGWLDLSTDGGVTWYKVLDLGPAQNWYNDLGNQWWDGTSSGGAGTWVTARNILTGAAGQSSVKVRFVFSSDASVTEEGFGVDSVSFDLAVGVEDINASQANLAVYPNPSNGLFKLVMNTESTETYELSLRNVQGKEIFVEQINVNGNFTKDYDFANVAKGVYFLRIQNEEETINRKVIIQ